MCTQGTKHFPNKKVVNLKNICHTLDERISKILHTLTKMSKLLLPQFRKTINEGDITK